MVRSNWNNTTNLEKAFTLILDTAVTHRVPSEDMPTDVVVLSDMQFDPISRGGVWNAKTKDALAEMFRSAGYTMPNMIWWNLRSAGNTPATADQDGNILVSGFSPSLFKTVMSSKPEDFTPLNMMFKIINDKRYDIFNTGDDN